MHGGDEVSAIVFDLGSHSCRSGYAGEDQPKSVFPSAVGSAESLGANTDKEAKKPGQAEVAKVRKLYAGVQALGYRRDHMEVLPAMKGGLVADWDVVESLWDHAFRDRLLIDPKEHPMLIAEPSFNTQQHREKMVELMFERYDVPALFLAKNAVLTSFASGRATSLVVDCGGGSVILGSVAAVHDGYVLQKAVVRSPIGGEVLTDCLQRTLEAKGIIIRPRFSFKRKEIRLGEYELIPLDPPNTTDSYYAYAQRAIVADIKESICRVPDSAFDDSSYANIPTTPYELPDGQIIEVGADRFKISDILFNPTIIQTIPGMENFSTEAGTTFYGLPQMVIESINKCDVDLRRELFNSVMLAGGTAAMHQMKERLEKDLMEEAPPAARVKVLASGNALERRFSVWIGGSILASMGSFQQMWFSKAEYEEHGPTYVQRKCP
ncbi:actin-related protein 4 [Physcomitrium patens]|uniref:Actin-related protein 4 n=1 Tax=Physcomitrium patens TaxID=3218 RepID=A0A2K1K4D4_PHYPA|nr:actin-related protein 4-like isoform X1 [Physcomitrium patens]XP_024383762.1 actin-related protein 4-like isoform X1 [Physcomitrium patens]PNR48634.1 hypothetical protein PHYPA_013111 [Physcomitrium patens]|eukprot:XP_024383760.1 actin-related protein 4-like isoform X1 [Physcomitrella patens]